MHIDETKRITLLGSHLDCLTMTETMRQIETVVEEREKIQHVVINAGKINMMYQNQRLQKIVNASQLVNADGQSVVWAARFLGYEIPERVTGIDLFLNLIELSAKKGYRVYYFGAAEEVVCQVMKQHQRQYPELKIAGYRNGYFEEAESETIVNEMNQSGADLLFVAFSSPKKEFWVHQHREKLEIPFVMGVGGSFDVVAGKTQRAPKWMQKTGLEWFYRFIQEPRRLFKRYIVGNLVFAARVLAWKYQMKEQ